MTRASTTVPLVFLLLLVSPCLPGRAADPGERPVDGRAAVEGSGTPEPTTPAAGSGEVLTLDRAVAIALENNHMLRAADAGQEAAEARVGEAKSWRLPRVDLWETFMRTTNPVYVFGNLLNQERFGPQHFDPNFLNHPPPLDNFQTKLSLEVPLWTGGRLANGIRAAEAGAAAAKASRERTRQEVVRMVLDAYTGAVLAKNFLAVARDALETARAHVKLVADMEAAGLVVKSDLLQAKVRESEIEEMVIRARSAVSVSRAALNMALGRDLDAPVEVPAALPVPDRKPEELDALVREALERRPDLLSARKRKEAADRMVRVARGGFFPEIGVAAWYEGNQHSRPGTAGDSWSLVAAAKFTAFDGARTRAQVRTARARARQADEMTRLMEQKVALEVRQAWHDLAAALQRLEEARHAVEWAKESLKIVEDRYQEGLTTLVELLDAETRLTGARTREVSAQRDVMLARAALDLAVGRL